MLLRLERNPRDGIWKVGMMINTTNGKVVERNGKVVCPCGVCGNDIVFTPYLYKKRVSKSKSGLLYHQDCYRGMLRKPVRVRSQTKFTTKLGTGKPYLVSGSPILGYKITLPMSAMMSREYTCIMLTGGVLVYTPVIKPEVKT
jgi:hypothetical protein